MPLFNALIGLTEDALPPGLPPVVAVQRVRSAIEAMPGAGSVAVTWRSGKPAGPLWVEIHRPKIGHLWWSDETGEKFAKLVRAEARRALFPILAAAQIGDKDG